MSQEELSPLFEKLIVGKMSLPELERLSELLQDNTNTSNAETIIATYLQLSDTAPAADLQVPFETMLAQAIQKEKLAKEAAPADRDATPILHIPPTKSIRKWLRYTAAAAILLLVGTGGYMLLQQYSSKQQNAHNGQLAAVADANNAGPALRLADGTWLHLDSLQDGLVAQQNGAAVSLTKGQLAYQQTAVTAVVLNEVRIPAGRQFRLVLPDGTKVWLNAKSSIKYPVAFTGKERKVMIAGEAYFEVERHPNKTFRVESRGQAIEVLGTHFNINTYPEEPVIRTTLLEGSVRVIPSIVAGETASSTAKELAKTPATEIASSIPSSWLKPIVLQPGEQAQLQDASLQTSKVSLETTMAWRSGKFEFNNEDIHSIMRKLARWYGIDVVYKGDFKGKTFTGSITMNSTLEAILDKISYSKNVQFNVTENVVTVLEGASNK